MRDHIEFGLEDMHLSSCVRCVVYLLLTVFFFSLSKTVTLWEKNNKPQDFFFVVVRN